MLDPRRMHGRRPVIYPPPVRNGAGLLGTQLLMEAAKRLPKGPIGFVRADCADDLRQAARESAYCIDAPDEMPAGGCYGLDCGGPLAEDDALPNILPAQLTVMREGVPEGGTDANAA